MTAFLFTLKEYLNTQKQLQIVNGSSVTVPTMEELAAACNMQMTPFSRMINNRTDGISRAKVALIIAELRRRGFDPSLDDLFAYYD